MRRIIFILAFSLLIVPLTNAQSKQVTIVTRTGYINSETIYNSLPEYKSATQTLESLSKSYEDKVKAEFAKIETLYNNYQSKKANMSASERANKENEIISKERAAKQLQQSYFGEDGAMQKKSEELLEPIRKKVQKAIDKVAASGNYMIIFDVAMMQGVAYTNEAADLSTLVIK